MIVTWGSCIAYVYDNKLIKERRAECVCVHAWTGNNTVMNSNVAFHVRYFTLLLYCASFVRRKSLSQFTTRVNKREDTCTSGRLAVDQSNYTLGVTLLDTVRPLCLPHKLLSPTKSFSCRAPVFFFFVSGKFYDKGWGFYSLSTRELAVREGDKRRIGSAEG